ncbi:hypothetical protein RFI_19645, partial [Reticulomyxa filosa]
RQEYQSIKTRENFRSEILESQMENKKWYGHKTVNPYFDLMKQRQKTATTALSKSHHHDNHNKKFKQHLSSHSLAEALFPTRAFLHSTTQSDDVDIAVVETNSSPWWSEPCFSILFETPTKRCLEMEREEIHLHAYMHTYKYIYMYMYHIMCVPKKKKNAIAKT